jgi:hypothetical protein
MKLQRKLNVFFTFTIKNLIKINIFAFLLFKIKFKCQNNVRNTK